MSTAVSTSASPAGWRSLVRALRSRNYRLFFSGQSVSLIGSWISKTAVAWLVFELSKSEMWLGIVGFASQAPAFFLSPIAGVWVDRSNRHRVLVVTQVMAMLQSFALAALALSGVIRVWHIVALSVAQGLINAVDMPARQAFLVEMVESREDLSNGIALNSSMVHGARLIGPPIAAALIAVIHEGGCFTVDGISYMAVIASLLLMNVRPRELPAQPKHWLADLKEGAGYTFGFEAVRSIMIFFSAIVLAATPYTVLLPVFAERTLHGGASTLGLLMGAGGGGALLGAFYLAARQTVLGLGRVMNLCAAGLGLGLLAFAWCATLWLALPLLVVIGLCSMIVMAGTNTVLQTVVPDAMRGRVMAFYMMAFMGMAPLSSLLAGAAAHALGAEWVVAASGALCLLAAGWFFRELPEVRRQIRPIYVERGILPEVAQGMNTAAELAGPTRE